MKKKKDADDQPRPKSSYSCTSTYVLGKRNRRGAPYLLGEKYQLYGNRYTSGTAREFNSLGSNERWIHATLPRVRHYRRLLPSLCCVSFPSDKRTRRLSHLPFKTSIPERENIRRTDAAPVRATATAPSSPANGCLVLVQRPTVWEAQEISGPQVRILASVRVAAQKRADRIIGIGGKDPARQERGGAAVPTDGSAVAAPRFRNNSIIPPRQPLASRPPIPTANESAWSVARGRSCSAPSAWSLRYATAVTGFLGRGCARGLFLACGHAVFWRRHGNSARRGRVVLPPYVVVGAKQGKRVELSRV